MPKHEFIKSTPERLQYGVTDNPKPEHTAYMNNEDKFDRDDEYYSDYKQWLQSITWHEVRKKDKEIFENLASEIWSNNQRFNGQDLSTFDFDKALAEMVEIPNGLVGLEEERREGFWFKYPYIIKQKEETQEELIDEVISIAQLMTRINAEKELKQKFEIKRR